jgi:methionine-rich copper-binding protein CopC
MRRLLSALLVVLAALAGAAAPASAHSGLIEGRPGPSDKPQAGLTTITLTFAPLSRTGTQQVKVLDPAQQDRVTGIRQVADGQLEVTVRPLAAGVHLVQYTVTSQDGHASSGGYYLDVRGGAAPGAHVPPGLTGLLVTLGVVVALLGLLLWRAGRRRRAVPAG